MAHLAGSKRPASTPFASPCKAASKRSRTKYDYGDDDDTESWPEDQWSAEDAESLSWDSEDDDMRNFMPSPPLDFISTSSDDLDGEEMRYEICCSEGLTEFPQDAGQPLPKASTSCHCGTTNFIENACLDCECSSWGSRRKPDICDCHGGSACHNVFGRLDVRSIFGPDPVTLHECFITWVLKQREFPTEHITMRFLFDLALQCSYHVKDTTDYDEPYRAWWTKWDALPKPEQDIEVGLRQEMNRIAFTKSDLNMKMFFSFCRQAKHWENANDTWHCRICGNCVNWNKWHCAQCNKCTDGSPSPCSRCGGVAALYQELAGPSDSDEGY